MPVLSQAAPYGYLFVFLYTTNRKTGPLVTGLSFVSRENHG